MRLKDRVALITGASRGIGKGIALAFAAEGADIIVNYSTSRAQAEQVVQEIQAKRRRAVALQADIGEPKSVRDMVERAWSAFGRIDILVNNAASAPFQDFLTMPYGQWRRVLAVNLDGAMLCSQEVARRMIAAGIAGKILNISSLNARQVERSHVHYNVSKAGLDMLTKCLAVELGPHGINVNGMAPDLVRTEILPEGFWEEVGGAFAKRTPLGRKAEVEDCLGPAVFLVSEDSKYLQGQTILLDGGMSIFMI
jgi:NAD(P)-dependent dehydrogenase (short-subunit alcohol dehydrogenase family)